jgi:DNA-binding GntR family transcriptional regulator
MSNAQAKTSLVDVAEEALRRWLATGRHRVGERLPPEQELSARLGISRGTLRTALGRLERSGEIVRRQGSGTFVGQAASWALDEGLEKLVSYSELARQRGVQLEVGELDVRRAPDTGETVITRVLLMDGQPGAHMTDVVRAEVELPAPAKLRQALERGDMVLDVLLKAGVPVAYNRSHIAPVTLTPEDPMGGALGVTDTTAALRIEHDTCTAEGTPVESSVDIFLPRSLDLHVVRWLEDVPPVPAIGRARS